MTRDDFDAGAVWRVLLMRRETKCWPTSQAWWQRWNAQWQFNAGWLIAIKISRGIKGSSFASAFISVMLSLRMPTSSAKRCRVQWTSACVSTPSNRSCGETAITSCCTL